MTDGGLAAILPSAVASASLRDFTAAGPPLAVERATLGDVGPARSAEFAAGRQCARAALGRLGFPRTAVPRAADRSPRWPTGVVGSITHCPGYCVAAVGRATQVAAIGVDAEPNAPLPGVVWRRVATPEEARGLPSTPGVHWDRVLFSAKESVYKVWAPLTGAWLGFRDAEVTVDPVRGLLRAALRVPSPFPYELAGRFLAQPDLLLTAIVVRGA